MFAGFSIIPFLAQALVRNVGMPESQLGLIYLAGGLITAFTSPLFGRWSDRWGPGTVFGRVAIVSILPVVGITMLPPLPVWAILIITTIFMVIGNGRWVAALALINNAVEARSRGAFMSLNSSIQQVGAGFASLLAGWMVADGPGGRLLGYPRVGVFAAVCVAVSVVLARRLGSATAAPLRNPFPHLPEPQGASS